jgi:glycosyltransferase involved in cell wall biosynthesis
MTLRVLHLIDTGGPGGAETVYLELARGLRDRGHECVAVVPEHDWLEERLVDSGMTPIHIPSAGAMDFRLLGALRRLIREHDIDVVQAHLLASGVYGSMAALLTGVPVVSTFHGLPDISDDDRLLGLKARILQRPGNRVVCVSHWLRHQFVRKGVLSERTIVIPNGIDLHELETRAADLRGELALPDHALLVGAIGNIRRSKAYPLLARAFAQVRDHRPDVHLVVAGHFDPAGDVHAELDSTIERLDLGGHIHLLGFRDDVGAILRDLDAFVLSSTDEGFSLATVQAMGMGLPSVVTRSGGPEEIVRDDEGAILVEPGDVAALARGILTWVDRLDDRRRVRLDGTRVREEYSVGRMVDRYERVYREVTR